MRYLTALLTAIVLLTACGSDSESTDAATTTEAAATTTEAEATTTEAETTTTTTEAETTTTEASLDGVDPNDPVVVAYCEDSLAAEQAANEFTSSGAFDPASVEAFYADQIESINEAVPPPQIEAEFNIVKANLIELEAAFASIGYDISGSTTEIDAISNDAVAEAATETLDEFEAMYCPELETEDDPGIDLATLVESEAGRALLAEGISESTNLTVDEALCFVEVTPADVLQQYVDFADSAAGPPSNELVAALLGSMDECGLDFTDFIP